MATSPNIDAFSHIVTRNPQMQDIIAKAKKFALLDAPLFKGKPAREKM